VCFRPKFTQATVPVSTSPKSTCVVRDHTNGLSKALYHTRCGEFSRGEKMSILEQTQSRKSPSTLRIRK
jgi:hypothetical protein